MMKRLIIVCEGPTEQEFCKDVLAGYFFNKGIYIEYPTIKHSNGGIVAWETIKKQIVRHLHEENVVVSLFVDFYRIRDSYNFPGWMESKAITDVYKKMVFIFDRMSSDMGTEYKNRFIPYIQLHEFEGLLFSDLSVFENNFTKEEIDIESLRKAVEEHNSPEEINNGPNTAPSERLKRAIKGYDKIVFGACLASEIGIETIKRKCKLFNDWIARLEKAF